MGKTYQAMMNAQEAAKKKQTDKRKLFLDGPGASTIDDGLSSDGRGLISEEYLRLKLNILRMSPGGKTKSILFSCPTGREGASAVLTQFGIALAGQKQKVLLVDANMRNPSFHKAFNVERENGLTDLFLGKSTLQEVIKRTQFNNLSIITSGSHFNPFSIFESNSLDSHIAKMKAEADWVLFDSPPINFLNDSIFLAPKVDGVVMVIEAEKTRWEVAQSAKQRIEAGNGKILGVILNKRKFYIPNWLYRTL